MRKKRGTKPGAARGGKRLNGGGPGKARSSRQAELAERWDPTRPVRSRCIRGHKKEGGNVFWQESRGRVVRRCRKCARIAVDWYIYQKKLGRKVGRSR
jgi:hypothetical protein